MSYAFVLDIHAGSCLDRLWGQLGYIFPIKSLPSVLFLIK